MGDELKFPDASGRGEQRHRNSDAQSRGEALSEPLVRLVREAYLPPTTSADSASYWQGLEQRIMARATAAGVGTDNQWWSVLGAWAQTGLIAAAAIFAVAGVINQRVNASDSQFVYESVVQPATPEILSAPKDLLSAPEGARSDATLSYVLSH